MDDKGVKCHLDVLDLKSGSNTITLPGRGRPVQLVLRSYAIDDADLPSVVDHRDADDWDDATGTGTPGTLVTPNVSMINLRATNAANNEPLRLTQTWLGPYKRTVDGLFFPLQGATGSNVYENSPSAYFMTGEVVGDIVISAEWYLPGYDRAFMTSRGRPSTTPIDGSPVTAQQFVVLVELYYKPLSPTI